MAAGNNNGKNYGGGHTGDGKKKHTGHYNTNGVRIKRISHSKFKPGMKVIHNKSGMIGTIISKEGKKLPRSLIKVRFNDTIEHIYSWNLHLEDYFKNEKKDLCNKSHVTQYKNKECVKDHKSNRDKRNKFKKAKKEFRDEIINGIGIKYNGTNNETKNVNTSSYYISSISDNALVIEINETNYKYLNDTNQLMNNRSNMRVADHFIPKYKLKDNLYLTPCGSTGNIIRHISNKQDYYKLIEKYMNGVEEVKEVKKVKNKPKKVTKKPFDQYKMDRLLWGLY